MIIFFFTYIIGCYLSLFRVYGSAHSIQSRHDKAFVLLITGLSWLGFFAGILVYIQNNSRYFFKLTNYNK